MLLNLLSLSATETLNGMFEDIFDGVNESLPVNQIEKDPFNIRVVQTFFLL